MFTITFTFPKDQVITHTAYFHHKIKKGEEPITVEEMNPHATEREFHITYELNFSVTIDREIKLAGYKEKVYQPDEIEQIIEETLDLYPDFSELEQITKK